MFGKRKAGPAPLANASQVYQQGLAAFEMGRYSEAIEKLKAIADDRSLPGTLARFYLGQAWHQQGIVELSARCYAEATRCFSESRRINPDSAGLSRYLAICHAGQGRFDLAAWEIERQQAAGEPDHLLPIRLAHALLRDGRHERAVETLTDAIESAPFRADLRLQLGLILASAGEYDDAIRVLQAAAKIAPFDAMIHQHLGLAYGAVQRVAEAVGHLRTAQRLAPHDAYLAELLTMATQAAAESGIFDTLDAEPPTARRAEDDPSALDALGRILEQEPDFVEAFLHLPESEIDADVFAMLAGTLERALERHPDYADLHYHCSRIYQRLGRTDAAIDAADQAVRIKPRFVQALIQLGRLYAQTDRDAEAIDRLGEALDSGGNYPDVHYLLGELHRKRGDRASARTAFHRALELNSNYERARAALESVAV